MNTVYIPNEDDLKRWVREAVRQEVLSVVNEIAQAKQQEDELLLTRKEIAQHLRISLVTLTDWVKHGLPAHAKRGRVLFIKSEVLAWVKENR